MAETTNFVGGVAGDFSEHYDEVRGYVREEVSRHHIVDDLHIDSVKPKLRIADVGGGEGRNAAWLASLGHEVVMFEPSPDYVAMAQAREDAGSFEIVSADAKQAHEMYVSKPFDVVISHGVGMYQPDLKEHLHYVSGLTKKKGSASIMEAGRDGKIARYGHLRNLANLESLRQNGVYSTNLGLEARAYAPDEFERVFRSIGYKVLGWYGIRIFTDYDRRKISEVEENELKILLDEETRMSSVEEIRGLGQMLQFIVRKR